jgi:predicted transcriptional regulator
VLKDGEWHPIGEVIEKCGLSMAEAKNVMGFLEKYEFIEINTASQEVRIASSLKRFLLKVEI